MNLRIRIIALLASLITIFRNGSAELPKQTIVGEMHSEVGDPVSQRGETLSAKGTLMPALRSLSPVFYDHGEPTVYEQLMLEYVNRARANPGAEAARLGIDLNENLDAGTILDTPKPPLAFHPALIDSGRTHSDWMLATDTFSHTGAGGSSGGDRMETAGYVFSGSWTWGENIAWGGSGTTVEPISHTIARHDGLFLSSGHRENLMNADFDEVGIGVRFGGFTSDNVEYNASMVTQNFVRSTATPSPFAVGVTYYDFNGNNFYDVGEGIGGVEVMVSGGSYFTLTGEAGGYVLPVSAAGGTQQVMFTASETSLNQEVVFPALENQKVDLILPYSAPVISGSDLPVVGQGNIYTFTRVFGATGYRIFLLSRVAAALDGAETLDRVVDGTSGDYAALSDSSYSGSFAYHFAHPGGTSRESLLYHSSFQANANAQLRFRSSLKWAATDQYAQVLVSADAGNSWDVVYSQAGAGSAGESDFTLRTIDLSAYAGEALSIQFAYVFEGGSYYPQTSNTVGWFVDEVEFVNLEEITELGSTDVAVDEDYVLTSASAGQRWIQVAPIHNQSIWPVGNALEVTIVTPTEIVVEYNGINIADNDSTPSVSEGTDFGSQDYRNGSATRTFRVRNTGGITLTLGTESSSSNPFTVSGLNSSIPAGEYDDFTVVFDPTSTGTKTATIRFSTNDSDENPFNFSVQGVGIVSWNGVEVQELGVNAYYHDAIGQFDSIPAVDGQSAWSESLQANVFNLDSGFFSPQYGSLTASADAQWTNSGFFGWTHYGEDENQYDGWVWTERFQWMKFVQSGESSFLWTPMMNSWIAVNEDGSFTSFQWGKLTPEGLNRYESSIFGGLTTGDFGGWVSSDRFGWMWANGDGTWYWSETRKEWLGVTAEGGIWSTAEGRFL